MFIVFGQNPRVSGFCPIPKFAISFRRLAADLARLQPTWRVWEFGGAGPAGYVGGIFSQLYVA